MSPPVGDSGAQHAIGQETLEFSRSLVSLNRMQEL
jgi:hypothetical protein